MAARALEWYARGPMSDPTTDSLRPQHSRAPGKQDEPVPVLVARWMLLGCAATVAVVIAAFVVWGVIIAQGLAK